MKKRWQNKEEAEKYIQKCFQNNNFGLSYCAACDYVGIKNPAEYRNKIKSSHLAIYADCLIGLKREIKLLEYEVNNSEYVENHKFKELDNYLASTEEYLQVAKEEYKYLNSEEFKELVRKLKNYERKQKRKQ